MNAEQRQKYLESEGIRCPYCDTEDIESDNARSANYFDGFKRDNRCKKCEKEWTDIYTLTDVEDN